MNTNDNFDALWGNLREAVKQARTERANVQTRQDLPRMDRIIFGGTVRVSTGDADGSHIHLARGNWSGLVSVSAEDLRSIAAQCLAAAEEVEEAIAEAQAVRPNTTHA